MRIIFACAALALMTVAANAQYYPRFARSYYDVSNPRYYQPYRYAPRIVAPNPYRYNPPRYDWSWGGGNRGYLGGRGGGWGGEW